MYLLELSEPQQSSPKSVGAGILCDRVHSHSALPFNVHHGRGTNGRDLAKSIILRGFPVHWTEGQVSSQD